MVGDFDGSRGFEGLRLRWLEGIRGFVTSVVGGDSMVRDFDNLRGFMGSRVR